MSNIKPCRLCGEVAEHYESIPTCCKTCWRAKVTARRERKIDEIRAYDRARGKLPHRKEMFLLKTKHKRATCSCMQSAHNHVSRAVKNGTLVKPLRCERCGSKGVLNGHHDDYTKPLVVMWLCPICHAQRHKELGRLRTVDGISKKGGINEEGQEARQGRQGRQEGLLNDLRCQSV